jgi:hypothetical protein
MMADDLNGREPSLPHDTALSGREPTIWPAKPNVLVSFFSVESQPRMLHVEDDSGLISTYYIENPDRHLVYKGSGALIRREPLPWLLRLTTPWRDAGRFLLLLYDLGNGERHGTITYPYLIAECGIVLGRSHVPLRLLRLAPNAWVFPDEPGGHAELSRTAVSVLP